MATKSGQRRWVLEQLRRVTPLRIASRFPRALLKAMFETRSGLRHEYEQQYSSAQDPWCYAEAPHQARHAQALELLARATNRQFGRAVEVGCGEGMFTERVAPLCTELLALDFSGIALQRAKERCRGLANISFSSFDIRTGKLNGGYDLVIAMDVLECLHGPRELRRTCSWLVDAVNPGGWLLVTTSRHDDENTWWSKWLLRGRRITDYVAAQRHVEVVSEYHTGLSHGVLYRRKVAETLC